MQLTIKYKGLFKNSGKMNNKFYVSDGNNQIFLGEEDYKDIYDIGKTYNFIISSSWSNGTKNYYIGVNDEQNIYEDNKEYKEEYNKLYEKIFIEMQKIYDKQILNLKNEITEVKNELNKVKTHVEYFDKEEAIKELKNEGIIDDNIIYEKVEFFDEGKHQNFFEGNE